MQKAAHQTDENEHAEEQTNGKSKGKADKTSVSFQTVAFDFIFNLNKMNMLVDTQLLKIWMQGAVKKRGRSTGVKSQPKVVKKKAPAKRAKTKK